ncbi:hypothetical protein ACPA9J_35025 [Pseudomonas aeruginosa]
MGKVRPWGRIGQRSTSARSEAEFPAGHDGLPATNRPTSATTAASSALHRTIPPALPLLAQAPPLNRGATGVRQNISTYGMPKPRSASANQFHWGDACWKSASRVRPAIARASAGIFELPDELQSGGAAAGSIGVLPDGMVFRGQAEAGQRHY